ncbi:Hypothetical predicted protein [Mytilus galloprovincialis]|uniref:C1q domain-containing protein n=1 Tax=Mytilus galloprovincialis TaxID=29158 RepID=A0A8B6CVM5_MYTGA|nr:Hypothetical predicted protein [Mytilus galloprovincialis]
MVLPPHHKFVQEQIDQLRKFKTRYTNNLSTAMMMTHVLTCILFMLMFSTSKAQFTATLPSGYNTANLQPCIQYNMVKCLGMGVNYNPMTGEFTATVAGNYLVSVTMMTGTVAGHTNLMKNNDPVYVWLFTGNQYDMGTQVVLMNLAVNDRVWVRMANGASTLFDVYNTFSAVRVPPP